MKNNEITLKLGAGSLIPGLTQSGIFDVIASYVPAYRWHGQNKLHVVSKSWNVAVSQAHLSHKGKAHSASKSINACHTAQEALFVLSDEALLTHCRFGEIIHLVALHPELAKRFLSSPEVQQKLEPHFLPELASKSDEVANFLLDSDNLRKLLAGWHLARLGRYRPELALRILKDEGLCAKLDSRNVCEMGEYHFAVADFIMKNDKLRKKLKEFRIVELVKRHETLALGLLDTPDIDEMSSRELASLGSYHVSVAHQILVTDKFWQKIFSHDLVTLGHSHEDIAWLILKTPHLRAKIKTGYDLSRLCFRHEAVAFYALKTPHLRALLSGEDLGQLGSRHASIAQYILATPELHKMVLDCEERFLTFTGQEVISKAKGLGLKLMGQNNTEAARHIVQTPLLYNQLSSVELAFLGKNHVEIAWTILKNPTLRNRLDGHALALLGEHNIEIARYILDSPDLSSRLNDGDLACLGLEHGEIGMRILREASLRSRLDQRLIEISRIYRPKEISGDALHIGMAKHILNCPELCKAINMPTHQCGVSFESKAVIALQQTLEVISVIHHIAKEIKAKQIDPPTVESITQTLEHLHLNPPSRPR